MNFIFNKNHNRTHIPGCRAVSMMNRDKNEVPVDEPRGHSCKWCKPGLGYQTTLGKSQERQEKQGQLIGVGH